MKQSTRSLAKEAREILQGNLNGTDFIRLKEILDELRIEEKLPMNKLVARLTQLESETLL